MVAKSPKSLIQRQVLLLCLLLGTGLAQAHGGIDGDAVVGGALGGAAGAAVGSAIGGRDTALIGGALGAAAGVAMNTRSRPNYVEHREPRYYYREGHHDHGRHRGHYKRHRHHGHDD